MSLVRWHERLSHDKIHAVLYRLFWAASLARQISVAVLLNFEVSRSSQPLHQFLWKQFDEELCARWGSVNGVLTQRCGQKDFKVGHATISLKIVWRVSNQLLSSKIRNIKWVSRICAWYTKTLADYWEIAPSEKGKLAGATKYTWHIVATKCRLRLFVVWHARHPSTSYSWHRCNSPPMPGRRLPKVMHLGTWPIDHIKDKRSVELLRLLFVMKR